MIGLTGCQNSGGSMNQQGVRLFQQGQSPAAIRKFQESIAANPGNFDAIYNLAASYHHYGRQSGDQRVLSQAESLYNQCLDVQPNHVACHRGLAVLLVDTDRSQRAFNLLRNWVDRVPNLSDARIELARLHDEFNEPESAQRYLTEAIDINPQDARAWTALAQIRESQGQLAQALNNYEQAYRLNQYQPGVTTKIASLQRNLAGNPRGSRLVQNDRWRQRR